MTSKIQNRCYQNTAQQSVRNKQQPENIAARNLSPPSIINFVNNNFPMSIIDDTVKTFINEKTKPAIEPNQDKIMIYDKINSELPNESITLILHTSPSVSSQGINYLTNASNTLILPLSPSATSQEINYLTNASPTL